MKSIIKNQKLFFISLIGIVIVSGILLTTFAYQTLQVEYKSGSKEKLTVTSGVLNVSFNVTNRINMTNMPLVTSYKSGSYSEFTINNSKSDADASYRIKLVDMEYSSNLVSSDFNYTLYSVTNNEIIDEGNFSLLSNTEMELSSFRTILKSKTETVRLYLWLKETTSNQNNLENSSFKGKIQIESMFDSDIENRFKTGTFAYEILNNAITAKNQTDSARTTLGSEVTTFTKVSGENEHVLNTAPDDYGTSYYYRGNVLDNYVSFADKIWRIVRINGDGSIRLVLDDVAKDSNGSVIETKFNSSYNDNAYVGYMYGTPGSTTYDATHENKNDSAIKIAVDKWYEDNLKTNYANYLSDTLFCNDKTLASSGIGGVTTQLGYGTNKTYYASVERLYYSTGTTLITESMPTLKCAENTTNNYSRYTTTKGILPNGKETNGDLKYPIGLLTPDEVAYAGAYKTSQTNKTYYLYNSSISSLWWLSSPFRCDGSLASEWNVSGSHGYFGGHYVSNSLAFRPSINLKAETLKNAGDGTSSNPYTVKLS